MWDASGAKRYALLVKKHRCVVYCVFANKTQERGGNAGAQETDLSVVAAAVQSSCCPVTSDALRDSLHYMTAS